jgi:hypothetical protein
MKTFHVLALALIALACFGLCVNALAWLSDEVESPNDELGLAPRGWLLVGQTLLSEIIKEIESSRNTVGRFLLAPFCKTGKAFTVNLLLGSGPRSLTNRVLFLREAFLV